jgi:PAS domain S-box-containing protein
VSATESARTAEHLSEREDALAERVGRAVWILVAGTSFLAASELLFRFGENPRISTAQILCVGAYLVLLAILRRQRDRQAQIAVGLVATAVSAVTSATIAVLSGHSTTSMIVFVGIAMGAAAFIPWGGAAQLLAVAILGIIYPLEVYLNEGRIDLTREFAGLYVVLAGSVYIAYEIERQRRIVAHEQAQRLRRESEIERQRAFFHQVIDTNPHLIFAKDRLGRFTLANRAVAEVYGSSVSEIIGKTDEDFNPKVEEVDHFRSDDREVIETGCEKHIAEEVITDARGRLRYLETIKRPLLGADGRSEQVLGVATDITARKLAEEALREEGSVSATLAQIGSEIIASLSKPKALQRLCQLTAEAVVGDLVTMWILESEFDAFTAVDHFGYTAERWEELRVVRLPRSTVTLWLDRLEQADVITLPYAGALALTEPSARKVIPDARQFAAIALRRGGSINGALIVSFLQQSGPLSARQMRLAHGIGQLAALALENARLLDELNRANRLKSEFVATMSHELRTPLNVILGYDTLMRDGAMGEINAEQRQTLERIHENALQLLSLVTATLDMSRLEAGQVHVEVQRVDLRTIFAEIEAQMNESRSNGSVRFEWQVAAEVPPLLSDSVKLKVILMNLVSNALKFTAHGSVTATARAENGEVLIDVIDTGMGIAADKQSVIFEPFSQGDHSIGVRYGGVGLGLYIARRLVDLLGGSIRLQSEVGVGSTFSVRLPVDVRKSGSAPTHRAA